MGRSSIHISIPKPCHESWDRMSATERGAFCQSCRKEVIDFSAMTDRDVIEYLTKHKDSCGKFRNDQLNTRLTIPQIKNGFLKWRALAFGFLSMVSYKNVFASKNKPSTFRISNTKPDADTIINEPTHKNIRIEGRIEDDSTGLPLPYTTLSLTTLFQTKTEFFQVDSMGRFSFEVDFHSDGLGPVYIRATHIGYKAKWIEVGENTHTVQRFIICLQPGENESFHFTMGKMKIDH